MAGACLLTSKWQREPVTRTPRRHSALPTRGPCEASITAAGTPDGVTARVTVAAEWHPPLVSVFVPDGVPLESTATSRTALR